MCRPITIAAHSELRHTTLGSGQSSHDHPHGHVFSETDNGPVGVQPNIISKGAMPGAALSTERHADNKRHACVTHLRPYFATTRKGIDLNVPFHLFTRPLFCGRMLRRAVLFPYA